MAQTGSTSVHQNGHGEQLPWAVEPEEYSGPLFPTAAAAAAPARDWQMQMQSLFPNVDLRAAHLKTSAGILRCLPVLVHFPMEGDEPLLTASAVLSRPYSREQLAFGRFGTAYVPPPLPPTDLCNRIALATAAVTSCPTVLQREPPQREAGPSLAWATEPERREVEPFGGDPAILAVGSYGQSFPRPYRDPAAAPSHARLEPGEATATDAGPSSQAGVARDCPLTRCSCLWAAVV
jgi:hypothetical protein